ncbi:hypothetical protein LINPERPRIM_LOCUS35310 [Linum perenne]
MVVCSTILGPH